MSEMQQIWFDCRRDWRRHPEEFANVVTHGMGFVLSLVGAVIMLTALAQGADAWRALGCILFILSLVGVYGASTLSHLCVKPCRKRMFRMLDQGLIYFLIVSTYTPFALAYLRSPGWMAFLIVMWVIAIVGFCTKMFWAFQIDSVAVWVYLILGWMPVLSAHALIGEMSTAALWTVLAGGLCYTIGTFFLTFDHQVKHFHAIWHLWVIAGSAVHFFAILIFVATE